MAGNPDAWSIREGDSARNEAPAGSTRDAETVGEEDRTPSTRGPASSKEGWRRSFVGPPPRLDEIVELYRELGHEVRVEPLSPEDLADHCAGCQVGLTLFRVVYTREAR